MQSLNPLRSLKFDFAVPTALQIVTAGQHLNSPALCPKQAGIHIVNTLLGHFIIFTYSQRTLDNSAHPACTQLLQKSVIMFFEQKLPGCVLSPCRLPPHCDSEKSLQTEGVSGSHSRNGMRGSVNASKPFSGN